MEYDLILRFCQSDLTYIPTTALTISTWALQVGLIGTLLSRATLLWFVPLLKEDFPLFEDLNHFFIEFIDSFGKIDRFWIATIKDLFVIPKILFRFNLYWRILSISLWHQLGWYDFINAFWWGLQNDIKDLHLKLLDSLTLIEAIAQMVQYDNGLFEHW